MVWLFRLVESSRVTFYGFYLSLTSVVAMVMAEERNWSRYTTIYPDAGKMAAAVSASGSVCGRCEVCNETVARYRCPRCKIVTCSLPCVKRHKMDGNCDGIRDKTEFVNKTEFSDIHLLSDYRFLEESGRCLDNAERNLGPKYERLPYWTHKLGTECKRRGIELKVMPYKFSKRKQNTTKFIQAKRKIFWHVEWRFAGIDGSIEETKIDEDFALREVLSRLLTSRSVLKDYASAGLDNLCVLMQSVKKSANSKVYSLLDVDKTVCQNLRGKTVIEFPTLDVIFKKESHKYQIENQHTEKVANPPKETLSEDENPNQDETQNPNTFSISDSSDDDIHKTNKN